MSTRISRGLAGLFLIGAVVLVGAPDFTALERAVSKIFAPPVEPAEPEAVGDRASIFDPPRAVTIGLLSVPDLPDFLTVDLTAPDTAEVPLARVREPERPGGQVLVPLYASFIALQALDVHSTLRAVNRGAVEANPIMAPFADRPAAMVAFKAGMAAGIVYMTERVRRHSPLAAIVMMAAFNSAYVTVVANNYRVGNQIGR